ncbi:MAG TPA: flagellar filament capping protein FliD [Symbiobacteriaceae bacterium]|nr:flagellar filament capping protein FliD [Symbiobacteriaceae bacterium]
MGLLKIPGLASGLDTDGLIKTLMTLERRPVTTLQTRRDQMTSQVNAWRDLNTRVLTLQKRIEELGSLTSSDFMARKSTSLDPGIVSVTDTQSTAALGDYSVEVITLAKATSWQSGVMVDGLGAPKLVADPAAALNLSGTIQVSGGPKDGATFTIAATDSLNTIVSTINSKSSDLGFTASVSQVNPGDYRLVLKGNTGASSDFQLVDDAGSTVAADLKLTAAGATKLATAADGSMKVNGSTVTFSSNTVKDAIGGVTVTLNKSGLTTITVGKDQQRVIDAVKKVVDQYNSVIDFMEQQTSYDSKAKKAGTLFGDPRINDLRDGIRKVLGDKVQGQPDAYNSLGIVGVTTQSFAQGADYNGKLTFDQDKFTKALEANPSAMRDLFTASGKGVAVRAREYLDNYTKTGGILQGRADSIDKGVELIKKQITRWEEQILPVREQRLRDQFLGLEKAMSTLQNQGNWLSAQLKSLNSPSDK